MKTKRVCSNCKWNHEGICTGDGIYKYGEKILKDYDEPCDAWNIGFDYYCEIMDDLPWYIAHKEKRHKVILDEVVILLEKDEAGEPFDINIFYAIFHEFNLFLTELSEILGVTEGVIIYACQRGLPAKRLHHFSTILCIPEKFFTQFTNLDLPKLRQCRDEFFEKYKNLEYRPRSKRCFYFVW